MLWCLGRTVVIRAVIVVVDVVVLDAAVIAFLLQNLAVVVAVIFPLKNLSLVVAVIAFMLHNLPFLPNSPNLQILIVSTYIREPSLRK